MNSLISLILIKLILIELEMKFVSTNAVVALMLSTVKADHGYRGFMTMNSVLVEDVHVGLET